MNERQRIKNYGIIVHVRSLGLVLVDYLWMMSHFGVQPLGRARAWPMEYLPVALVVVPWGHSTMHEQSSDKQQCLHISGLEQTINLFW